MKTICVVGGGQLCLMMGEAIKDAKLPYQLIALDPTKGGCPATPFLKEQLVGSYKDEGQITRLGELSDFLTFEIELANGRVLENIRRTGKLVNPSPETLTMIQDKLTQAQFLGSRGLPIPDYLEIETVGDFDVAISDFGLPLMIKARTDSYDGTGNFVLRDRSQIDAVQLQFASRPLMAQRYIDFNREISVICARSLNGGIVTFPVGENIHGRDYNILETTIVPARVDDVVLRKATTVAENTMKVLDGAGVFGIEMLVKGEDVIINEIAPRVHNSGHYSIEEAKCVNLD